MSYFFLWFQCDNVAELEKAKQKKLEQIAELNEEVKAIDEKIKGLEG
jgi:flagellar motility protein MotE (MotC chaperone)